MQTIVENKKALLNYEVLEKFQAGIVLIGQEVKSIKLGKIALQGSFVIFKGGEVFLIGANVPPYQPKNAPPDYNPKRSRKLLLQKAEIKRLAGRSRQKSLTMAPLRVYNAEGKIKLEFAIVKSKKKKDKRERIRKREIAREISRELKLKRG